MSPVVRRAGGSLLLLALVACKGSHVGLPPGPALIGIGDSFVSGVGQPHEVWLSAAARASGRVAVNLGVPSTLSKDALKQAGRVAPRPQDVVVVDTGSNDLRTHGEDLAALEAFGRNLNDLLKRVDGAGCRVVVPPLPLLDYALYPPTDKGTQRAVVAYELRVQDVARERGALVADAASSWNPATMIAADQVHPNPLGDATIAASVARALARCPR